MISFEQPAPVGAASAVGQAQGLAALRGQQLAAASAYDQAAIAASAQLSAAQERGRQADNQDAVLRERNRFEADADYLRSATQLADTRMRVQQAAHEAQQRAAIAQQELAMRQKQQAFEMGELSPLEQSQLLRYQNAKGEVQQALAEGKLTGEQASLAMNRLQSQIGPLRLRKQVMDEYHQELQNQQLSQANARAASMEAENAKFHAKTVPDRVLHVPLPDGSSVAVLDNGPGRAPTVLPSPKGTEKSPMETAVENAKVEKALHDVADLHAAEQHPPDIIDQVTGKASYSPGKKAEYDAARSRMFQQARQKYFGSATPPGSEVQEGGGPTPRSSGKEANPEDPATWNQNQREAMQKSSALKNEIVNRPDIPQESKQRYVNAVARMEEIALKAQDFDSLPDKLKEEFLSLDRFVSSLPAKPPRPGPPAAQGPGPLDVAGAIQGGNPFTRGPLGRLFGTGQ